jgi:uncharacterized damage-inducible protein DinB
MVINTNISESAAMNSVFTEFYLILAKIAPMITKPQPGEFVPYQEVYINCVGDAEVPAVLEELKDSTYAFFTTIPEEKGTYAYAAGKWNIKEVLGHMIDTERVFSYRLMCFARGEKQELPGFEQDDYVLNSFASDRTLQDLASEFRVVREATLYLLHHLKGDQDTIMGKASGNPVSVRALAYMIPGHELHHLRILKEKYLPGLGIQV